MKRKMVSKVISLNLNSSMTKGEINIFLRKIYTLHKRYNFLLFLHEVNKVQLYIISNFVKKTKDIYIFKNNVHNVLIRTLALSNLQGLQISKDPCGNLPTNRYLVLKQEESSYLYIGVHISAHNFKSQYTSFYAYIENLSKSNLKAIIAGDFNGGDYIKKDGKRPQNYINFDTEYNNNDAVSYKCVLNKPTYLINSVGSCIDHFLIEKSLSRYKAQVIRLSISDHEPIVLTIKL